MQFINSFSLYDVFLVAAGIVTATLLRVLYDTYQDRKKIDELDKVINVYNESMDTYEEGILILSSDDQIIYINKEASRILGIKSNGLTIDILKKSISVKIPGSDNISSLYDKIKEKSNIPHADIISGPLKVPVSINLNKFNLSLESSDRWIIVVLQDIKNKLKLQEKLESIGTCKDLLTNLPTKYHLMTDLIPVAIKASNEQKVAALTLFAFKNFEKLEFDHGTEKTDKLIKSMSNSLSELIDKNDTLYRFNTNGFAILMTGYENQNIVRNKVNEFYFALQNVLFNEAVKGEFMRSVYFIDNPNLTADRIVNESYRQLWKKHIDHIDRAYSMDGYDIRPQTGYIVSKLTKEDFLNALEQKDFFFYYQPVYNMKKDTLEGVEILTRLNHKKYGFLHPDEFIPKAIEYGLMHEVTSHLLDNVLLQKKLWESKYNKDLNFTVNLALPDLRSGAFTDILADKLKEHDIKPSTIIIDIQESSVDESLEAVIAELNILDKIGVQICLEHFAKDFTNLKYLEFLPIDKIKIDSSIISNSYENEHKKRLIYIIVAIGRSLNLEVGANHVDSPEIRDMIEQIGCDFAQGYYFGKPMPAHEISEILMEENS